MCNRLKITHILPNDVNLSHIITISLFFLKFFFIKSLSSPDTLYTDPEFFKQKLDKTRKIKE
jgi:hypothetical protein